VVVRRTSKELCKSERREAIEFYKRKPWQANAAILKKPKHKHKRGRREISPSVTPIRRAAGKRRHRLKNDSRERHRERDEGGTRAGGEPFSREKKEGLSERGQDYCPRKKKEDRGDQKERASQ